MVRKLTILKNNKEQKKKDQTTEISSLEISSMSIDTTNNISLILPRAAVTSISNYIIQSSLGYIS